MSTPPLVPLLLAASWVVPAAIVATVYGVQAQMSARSGPRSMDTSVKGLRADIARLDFDARAQGWRHEGWDGPSAYVQARVTEPSHEVMLLAPYAEASVSVSVDASDTERRRCSLCLN